MAEPGYYERWEQADAGTGGGMLLEDAIKLYRQATGASFAQAQEYVNSL